ncbi:hypothetical protein PS684_02379 [Pseudomonas fluorescens]|nr:hypothetical protein PS684_02379 [Pseudomonas fluorescens]
MLDAQIALDARLVELAHVHGERHAIDLAFAGLAIEQRQTGQECHAGATGGHQLFASLLEGMRLADNLFAEDGYLIRADNQMSGVAVSQCSGFLFGEAFDQFAG